MLEISDSCPCGATIKLSGSWWTVRSQHYTWLEKHAVCREGRAVERRASWIGHPFVRAAVVDQHDD